MSTFRALRTGIAIAVTTITVLSSARSQILAKSHLNPAEGVLFMGRQAVNVATGEVVERPISGGADLPREEW